MLFSNCKYCGSSLSSKKKYWYIKESKFSGLKFCKKTCANKYEKDYARREDSGCDLCGKKKPNLLYLESILEGEENLGKYCSNKHLEMARKNPVILDIVYKED